MCYRIIDTINNLLPELFLGFSLLTVSKIISGVIFAKTKFSFMDSFKYDSKVKLDSGM